MTLQTNEDSINHLFDKLAVKRAKSFRPNPNLNLVEWAEQYRFLSTQSSAIGGLWRTSRFEVARGPMMAVTEPGVETISCMVSTQTLKTELLLNIIGYHAHLDPCPMLLVQPKEGSARAFSKERLGPMAVATPVLRKALGDDRARGGKDTLFYKEFAGGFVAMVYAGSPTELAMRPIRITMMDEIDKYEITKEGDPIKLGEERTATFRGNRLKVRVCSPTWEETSLIYKSYLTSDQRRAFFCCPHCDHWQTLDFFRNVHWGKTPQGQHFPMTADMYCEVCGIDPITRQAIPGKEWGESARQRMATTEGAIRWMQTAPFECCGVEQEPLKTRNWEWDEHRQCGYALCIECGNRAVSNAHAGFQAGKLFSPKSTVIELASNWVESKDDPASKQVFYNTQLGLPFALQAMRKVESHSLSSRKENFEAQVPEGALILTAGVDVQVGGTVNDGRIEVETVAWGDGYESWSVDYHVIQGDPSNLATWAKLDDYLRTEFIDTKGRVRRIEATCIDTGGASTETVYKYCAARRKSNVWGIKGRSETSGVWGPVWPPPAKYNPLRAKNVGYKPIMLGVNAAKEAIREFLLVEVPGPGYAHFPMDRPEIYFEQLTAEKLLLKYESGRTVKKWVQPSGRANEALDVRVYSYSALRGMMTTQKFSFAKRQESLAAFDEQSMRPLGNRVAAETRAASRDVVNPRIRRSNFMA